MSISRQPTLIDRAPIRVVVVDDDRGVRRALSRLLGVSGYDVRTFGSAEEYLRSDKPTDVDCLVVDLYLGGMSGLDLRTELNAMGPSPPIVFITAHTDARMTAMGLRSEGVVCLPKPFEDHTLMAAIHDAIEEARL